ncbi:AAA family ATPase [Streptomyces sp. NPDC101175]|uniref:helix-turn-helix transcriptional regulator n=1 Tax=Streptomyces sp. NPDC101175 TaxID=3366123 RepID=UPI003833CFFC
MTGRHELIGRQRELRAIEGHLGRRVPIVVRGPRGAGKSALLDGVAARCRDRGVRTLTVEVTSAGEEQWDLFGVQDVVRALRAGFADIGGPRLAGALTTVNHLCTPANYAAPAARGRLLHQLQRLFGAFHGGADAVVLFDDVDADPATVVTAASAALRAGCDVVVACDDESVALELTVFGEVAGHVVELGPLADQHVGELIAAATRQRTDPAVAPAIRTALGSLAGNPGAVLALCDRLLGQGRLTHVGGALVLADPDTPPTLPTDHWIVRLGARTHEFGLRLLALIADSEWFGMDDLVVFAAAVDVELGACGRAVDELTAAGALRCTPDGVLTLACPALGATAIDTVGPDRLRGLHLAFARHLGSHDGQPGHVLLRLADHLAAAGGTDIDGIDAVTLLESAAHRIQPVNPQLAARWRRSALARRAPAARVRRLHALVAELIRIGRYDWLGEVAAENTDASGELAAAACLAALHTGAAPPGQVAAGSLVDRWFGARRLFGAEEAEEVARALAPLGGTHEPPTTRSARQDGWFDPIGMFESVLGAAYGTPSGGPLALCSRIVDDYRAGRWDDALSGARTLVATYPAVTPVHEMARLLAAEICASRDELDLAESWLGEPDPRAAFPTLRGWVELGLLVRRGRLAATLAFGRRACTAAVRAAESGHTAGLHLLIIRYAFLAMVFGEGGGLMEIEQATRAWCGRSDATGPGVTELLLTAVTRDSFPAARAAATALRAGGHRVELATACLIAARFADDTRPWLGTADEIAEELGDTRLRTYIRSLARTRGVTLPRRTTSARSSAVVEARIIELVKQGMTNRQIAVAIRLSEKSVERHLTRLFARTGCRSRLDLVASYERGVLTGA